MSIEIASRELVRKPWGKPDLRPWSESDPKGESIGEVWFGRADTTAPPPALLLKLLFTRAPLSIQVHPDDTAARAAGLSNGKTEAWYILAAEYGARVALGLKRTTSDRELREALVDGTITELVAWRGVVAGEAVYVPAGTIHAIGPGLTIAEIQQRGDTTYRLFDHGRKRELHIEDALAIAEHGPPLRQASPVVLGSSRVLLVKSPYFAMERLSLPGSSDWWLNLGCESWLLVLSGKVQIGTVDASMGEVAFLNEDHARLSVGPEGLNALIAYALPEPITNLLERPDRAFARRATSAIADLGADSALPVRSTEVLS